MDKKANIREIILVCDATFSQRECKHKMAKEKIADYKYLLQELLTLGYQVKSITIDGKRGLYKAFQDYPVQK